VLGRRLALGVVISAPILLAPRRSPAAEASTPTGEGKLAGEILKSNGVSFVNEEDALKLLGERLRSGR